MWEPHRIITVLSLSKSHCSSQKALKETVVVLIIFAATVYGLFLFLHTSDLDANICQKKAELCLHKRSSRAKRAGDNKLQVMFPSSLATSSQALKEEVIGVEGEVVPVFFHVYSVGQTLPCLMRDLLFQGFVDPKFEWIGPNGLISKESQRFVITDNGNLVFDTIYVVDSGNYTCNLMYRLDLKQVTRLVRYTVYVYHNPNKSVRLEADFYATKCNNNEITKFEKHLQKQLEDAVQDLQCEVHHWNSACHGIKPSPMSHIFNFQFIVFPFALGWADDCSDPQCDQQSEERVKKAYTRIRSFIEDYPFKRKLQNIDYIANSLNGVKVDHCKPGFGKNVITSNQCEGCCVACPPGHFSARQDTICTPCAFGSFNRHYGKTECTNCPHNEATNRSGATSQQECHWIIYQWMLPVTSTIGTCIFLITIWIICRKYCKTPMKGKYVQVKEEDVKEEVKTLANIIKNVDLLEQKSKLRPSEFIVRHSPKHGVEFSDDQCIDLLSETDTETCRTFDTLKSDETTCPKSSMEECISPYTSDDSCFTSRSSTPQNLEAIFRHGR
ncbi:zona pellucida-binding protein 2-like isoform X1 [Hypanus sabinus]|uniref:zona pellucida-binding protein 2-like isoform X1 n=2 Tax=Hypanus sabinus TaxID=79690 RepID=UPI0028C4A6DE|nr:zona pellucida-binding protein 2-like isoform X1 [Hypanus sabinus]